MAKKVQLMKVTKQDLNNVKMIIQDILNKNNKIFSIKQPFNKNSINKQVNTNITIFLI